MADDYVTVVKKLLTSSQGQGLVGHSCVCYSNRLDQWPTSSGGYSTRCNPMFKVMREFLGSFLSDAQILQAVLDLFSGPGRRSISRRKWNPLLPKKLILLERSSRWVGKARGTRPEPRSDDMRRDGTVRWSSGLRSTKLVSQAR